MHKSTNIAEKLLKSQILRLKKEKKKKKGKRGCWMRKQSLNPTQSI